MNLTRRGLLMAYDHTPTEGIEGEFIDERKCFVGIVVITNLEIAVLLCPLSSYDKLLAIYDVNTVR